MQISKIKNNNFNGTLILRNDKRVNTDDIKRIEPLPLIGATIHLKDKENDTFTLNREKTVYAPYETVLAAYVAACQSEDIEVKVKVD
ncbi:MAG: hypothetical protein MJ180_04925 [Candidatus Gastranaerophilales bacterium]|nr:hypothetical protein [Candidatus Gastranaerophilales bacterium]